AAKSGGPPPSARPRARRPEAPAPGGALARHPLLEPARPHEPQGDEFPAVFGDLDREKPPAGKLGQSGWAVAAGGAGACDDFPAARALGARARAERRQAAGAGGAGPRGQGAAPDRALGVRWYTQQISALGKRKQWRQALDLLAEMRAGGVRPNVITYSALISACERSGQPERSLELLQEMKERRAWSLTSFSTAR
ncbi:unnamed protein product, partial [Prorocentrum cordatum]